MSKFSFLLAGAVLSLAPFAFAQNATDARASTAPARSQEVRRGDPDMQRAIAFERLKDRQANVQARKEARHPSSFNHAADRQSENSSTAKDPGERPVRKDK